MKSLASILKKNKTLKQKDELTCFLNNAIPKVLFVTHNRGGGVEKHIYELKRDLPNSVSLLILRPSSDGSRSVVVECSESLHLFFDYKSDIELLNEFLFEINLIRIHIHHTKGYSQTILDLILQMGVPWDYTIHDYYTICPQITLIDKNGLYCHEKGTDSCALCLHERPAPEGLSIESWRKKHQALISGAERCFVPSVDVYNRMKHYFPEANYITVYHEEISEKQVTISDTIKVKEHRLRVLVIGALTPMKGADLLESAAIDAKNKDLPIDYILIGEGYRKLLSKPNSNLEIMGKYVDNELQNLIKSCAPDLVWFTALWPETYSYTLSAAINAKLPVVAPNIGAFQERLYNRKLSWILPWNLKASAFNDFFLLLHERLKHQENSRFDNEYRGVTAPATDSFSYYDHYLSKNITNHFIHTKDIKQILDKLKDRTQPSYSLISIVKFNLLTILKKLREMSVFSWLVKKTPQSFQTRIKSWMLGESG